MNEYLTNDEISGLILQTLVRLEMETLTIKWEWNNRFTSRMGDASALRKQIRLSAPLWPEASPAERRDTVIHELCHITAPIRAGRRISSHGKEWKREMVKAGGKPERCHNVTIPDTLRRKTRRTVAVTCGCETRPNVTPYRKRQLEQGVSVICSRCRKKLELVP